MILNPDWHKPKEKPYFHQISLDCIDKLVKCIEGIAIENISEMFGYNKTGRVNIRIHRHITGKMWFGVG